MVHKINHLIGGEINPLAVVSFSIKKGRRVGNHPLKKVLFRKKYPILSLIFNPYENEIHAFFRKPHVRIELLSGKDYFIYCRSNKNAVETKLVMEQQLDNFISNLMVDK